MKLKNKKTGEILDVYSFGFEKTVREKYGNKIGLSWKHLDNLDECKVYNSISDLCDEWEDYEEPKTFIFIDDTGCWQTIVENQLRKNELSDMKEIGNYFETEEEAEKAVEKLKVLKTLRDKGFKFNGWEESVHEDSNIIYCTIPNDSNIKASEMDLLFGSEE